MQQNNMLPIVSRRGFLLSASVILASATIKALGSGIESVRKQELHPVVLKLAEQAKRHPEYGRKLESIAADYQRVRKDPVIVSGHLYSIYMNTQPGAARNSLQELVYAYRKEFDSHYCAKLEKIIQTEELNAITRLQALVELREQCQLAVESVDNYAEQSQDSSKQKNTEVLFALRKKLVDEAQNLFSSKKMDHFLDSDPLILSSASKIAQLKEQVDELLEPTPLISNTLLLPVGFVAITAVITAGLIAVTQASEKRGR